MRKFYLYKGDGAVLRTLDLNTNYMFFENPQGLGFEEKSNFTQVGDTFVLNDRTISQKPITGTMKFRTDGNIGISGAYTSYRNFTQFCEGALLTLGYTMETLKEYKRNVILSKISKGEIGEGGVIKSDIEFIPLGDWFVEHNLTSFDKTTHTFSLSNNGKSESGCQIIIDSTESVCAIQEIKLEQDGIILADVSFPLKQFTFYPSKSVSISSIDGEARIEQKVAPLEWIDIGKEQDFAQNIFFKIPKGNSTLTIVTTISKSAITLHYKEEYQTI